MKRKKLMHELQPTATKTIKLSPRTNSKHPGRHECSIDKEQKVMTDSLQPMVGRKRKADSLGRNAAHRVLHHRVDDSSAAEAGGAQSSRPLPPTGRGASTGWTLCPLCSRHSQKRFALGRGIAAHLHAVHTPWNPGKAERNRRRRLAERQQAEERRKKRERKGSTFAGGDPSPALAPVIQVETREKWDPTPYEMEEWDETVLRIVWELDEKAKEAASNSKNNSGTGEDSDQILLPGRDRNGQESLDYRDSLPPFLQAAADGDLEKLMVMIKTTASQAVQALLDSRDRHLSLAEHWTAGSGHLDCLKYLFELRDQYEANDKSSSSSSSNNNRKMRRRDGKTCLHYAARNGQLHCIRYLVEDRKQTVDEVSGDGTTPFHLACFGGQLETAQYLLEHGADARAKNEWGCSAAHWVGMTRNKQDTAQVRALCRLLQSHGVSFVEQQKQGHTALHKAAQRLNAHVIEWMGESCEQGGAGLTEEQRQQAGLPDHGGHTPGDIWQNFGGRPEFAQKIRDKFEG